jgi:hypothetical protein
MTLIPVTQFTCSDLVAAFLVGVIVAMVAVALRSKEK